MSALLLTLTLTASGADSYVWTDGSLSGDVFIASPTISNLAPTAATVCAGNVATFTATLGNVTGTYDFTLASNGSGPVSGTATDLPFSQTLTTSGSGVQTVTLTIGANGTTATASTTLEVGAYPDYAALVDLYNSTNGPNWTNKTGWLSNCDPCNGWFGVTCSGGRVTQINLQGNNLVGTLPASLSTLTSLQELYLDNNTLSGTLPNSWSTLTSLQVLWLFNNRLSGALPDAWSTLTSLRVLNLFNNTLSGTLPDAWSTLTSLQVLWLFNNRLSGTLPDAWSTLTSLRDFRLENNTLSGTLPNSWSTLTSLQVLFLNDNTLSGTLPDAWSTLTSLQALWLFNNALSGTLPNAWSTLTSLRDFRLNNNTLSGCYPASWSAFCGISVQDFSNNVGLPDGGSAAGFTAFCTTGTGSSAFVASATASQSTVLVGNTLSMSTSGGNSYSWTAPAGTLLSSPATNSVVSATLTTPGAKTFTILVIGLGGGCTYTTTVSVTGITPAPTISNIAPTAATVCAGSVATFTATLGNVTGTYDFTLASNGSGPVSGTATGTAFSQTLTASGSGVQTVTLTIGATGNTSIAFVLTVSPLPTATIVFPASASVNPAGPVVTVPVGTGLSYQVFGGGSNSRYKRKIVIDSINGFEIRAVLDNQTGIFPIDRAGPYTITVTDANGCSRTVTGQIVGQ